MRLPTPGRRLEVPPWVTGACLARRERALAATEAADGTWLVGTRDHLYAVAPGEPPAVSTFAWEQVQRGDWDRDTATLRLERIIGFGEPVDVHAFELPEPTALLQLVQERVMASVVLQRRVDLGKRTGFSVIGRRPPSGQGEVTWAFELDAGVDPDDPVVRLATEAALADARESLGL